MNIALARTAISVVANKNGGTAETGRQGISTMLNVLDKPPELNLEPVFSDRDLKVARDYLLRKLARAEATAQPFAEVATIDAKLATLILQRNPADENRKLSLETVAKYAADMAAGRWQGMNGQTIVISKDGYLNDGQHRLNAVIEAEAAIPFTIVFGADRNTRLTLDQNKTRTSGDYLGMHGVKYPNEVAAIATLLHGYETKSITSGVGRGTLKTQMRPTKALLHSYALKHLPDIEKALEIINGVGVRRITTYSRMAAAAVILGRASSWEEAERFLTTVIEGEHLGKTNPAYAVRERLIGERIAGVVPVMRTLEIIFRGWNAHRRGDRMSKMSLRGELPAIEG